MFTSQLIRKKGSVAIRTDNDKAWVGVFIDRGSNPLAFGSQLWKMLQENWRRIDGWSKDVLKCGYWEEFVNDGFCSYCGKYGVGQPTHITGYVLNKFKSNDDQSMSPDPHCNGHSHLPASPSVCSLHAKSDGLWIEWVYVINPRTYMLEVFRSVRTGETFKARDGQGRRWEQSGFRYFPTGMFNLHGNEPDWAVVESQGLKTSAYYHDKFQRCKKTTL
jgi:hypothetical protein